MFPGPLRPEFAKRPRLAEPHQHVGTDDSRVSVAGGFAHPRAHAGSEPICPRQPRQSDGGVRRLRHHDRPPADDGAGGGHEGAVAAAAQERLRGPGG